MTDVVYEAVAFAMRYWFIIAMAVILIAVISISVKEFRQRREVMNRVDEFLGYIEIIGGDSELLGIKYGLREENIVGNSKKANICIEDRSVKKTHALIYWQDDELYVSQMGRATTQLNDRLVERAHTLRTGDIIAFGDVEVRVFIKRKRLRDDY